MPDEEKDEEARWFRRDEQRWILVSDETGGEGRNFQFVDELIHYDNPWNAARIEQRIGRLDRLGRTRRDVISNVLYCCGVEEEGLIECLADGLGVYRQSISGLEFALRDIERDVILTAVSEGRDGLMARVVNVKEAVAAERISDESAEVLDEASFERTAAGVFLHAQSSPAREQRLERAFGQYFKAIASPRAVYFCREADYPEGIVSFQPEDVRQVPLGLVRDSVGRIPERRGTFYRAIAQERPDLEFFSVGNSFFDAVCDSLFTTSTGRAYAIECRTDQGKWRGFEFIFRVTCREKTALMQNGLLNQLDRVFGNRLEHVWIGEDGELSAISDSLLQLRRSLNKASKGRTWWNLTGEKAYGIETHYAETGWKTFVEQRFQEAQMIGRQRFSDALAERLAAEHNRLKEQERQLSVLKPIGWEDDVSAINLLRNAIEDWDVELEALGFLSVNGGLLSASNAR
jgi:ATP-dependent helicase HepA